MESCFLTILSFNLNEEYVNNINVTRLHFTDPSKFLPLKAFDLRPLVNYLKEYQHLN